MEGKKRVVARKDINKDFPLCGFVLCDCCGKAMTAAWSRGCRRPYPYYRCATRKCEVQGKSIRRDSVEGAFENLLAAMRPSDQLFEVARKMIADVWEARQAEVYAEKSEMTRQLKAVEKQIDTFLDRLVTASDEALVKLYERRLTELERQKLVLEARLTSEAQPRGGLDECIELALGFLSSFWNIHRSGDHAVRRLMLRLAFPEPVPYCRGKGLGT